jgi:hypothetical protein
MRPGRSDVPPAGVRRRRSWRRGCPSCPPRRGRGACRARRTGSKGAARPGVDVARSGRRPCGRRRRASARRRRARPRGCRPRRCAGFERKPSAARRSAESCWQPASSGVTEGRRISSAASSRPRRRPVPAAAQLWAWRASLSSMALRFVRHSTTPVRALRTNSRSERPESSRALTSPASAPASSSRRTGVPAVT